MPVGFNGDVVKLNLGMTLFEQPVQISHYFRMEDETLGAPDAFTDVWTRFLPVLSPGLARCMSADVTVRAVHIEDVINTANPALQRRSVDIAVNIPGTNGAAGTTDVSQTCGVISWRTAFSGRGEQGRSYVPGLAHTDIVAGRLDTGAGAIVSRLDDYARNLQGVYNGTDAGSGGWRLVLWRQHLTGPGAFEGMTPDPVTYPVAPHYQHNPVTRRPFNPLAAAHPIASHVIRSTVRTQRRRGIDVRIGRRH